MTYVIVGGVGARLQRSPNITGDLDIVLTHARALLTSTPAGRTAYLDLTQPIALSLTAIFHLTFTHITADYDPGVELVHRWRPEGGNVPDDLTDAQVSIYGGIARKR